jgi:hypothetical protein
MEACVDQTVEPGNVIPVLARLLLRLVECEEADSQSKIRRAS